MANLMPRDDDYIDLQHYWRTVRRHWLPAAIVLGSVVGGIGLYTFLQTPIYQAEGKLMLDKVNRVSSLAGLAGQSDALAGVAQQSNPLETEAEIIRSNPIVLKAIDRLQLKNNHGQPLGPTAFLRQLQVKTVRGTDVLQLTYRDPDPKLAAEVVNTLMQLYMESNVSTNRAQAIAARQFINQQLPKTEQTVLQAEAALRRFKEQNRLVALKEEANSAVESLAELETRISQVRADLANANARSAALEKEMGVTAKEAITITSVSQAQPVQQVLADLKQVEKQLAVERTRYRESHPLIATLQRQKAALQTLLDQRIQQAVGPLPTAPNRNIQFGELKQEITADLVKLQADRYGLTNGLNQLMQTYTAYQQRMTSLPRLEQQLTELERRVKVGQATYEALLQKLQEVQVTENQTVGNARVISPALVPDKPIAPRKSLNLLLGAILGILLAGAVALLLESRDRSVKTVEAAKNLFDYTLLGSIPYFGKKVTARDSRSQRVTPELPMRDDPYSIISSAYSMLQANLGFLSSDKPLKVIAITSSVPTEGKSSVSANLAVAAAQVGQRVLLIDADLRRPCQQDIWQLPNLIGFSNVLVGQADFHQTVQAVLPNLDVLLAGTLPPNPIPLLDSKKLESLIQSFSATYDLIIIDTPPLTLAADARLLGKVVDGLLLVIRPGVASTTSVAEAKQLLEQSEQTVLGIVVNGVIPEQEPDRYHYYAKKSYYRVDPAKLSDPGILLQNGTAIDDHASTNGSSPHS